MRAAFIFLKTANLGRAAMSPFRRRELLTLGEKLYRQYRHGDNPVESVKAILKAGLKPLRNVSRMTNDPDWYLRGNNPQISRNLEQALLDVGSAAEPRIRKLNQVVPAAAGAGAGLGVGGAAGLTGGYVQRQLDVEDMLANMPLKDRLQYLFLPQTLNTRPRLPYEVRRTE